LSHSLFSAVPTDFVAICKLGCVVVHIEASVASFPGHRRNVSPTAWEQG